MKKVFALVLVFLLLCGCNKFTKEKQNNTNSASSGVWLSYKEINSMLENEQDFKTEFQKVILNLKSLKIENLYFHVRAFGDSVYKSDYFPLVKNLENYNFDILEYVIEECHKNSIKLHAWINPYRISNSLSDVETLEESSPAYRWTHDQNTENDRNVCICNGIYLNPAEIEVQKLVVDGIREILKKYDVDGIHFDDYFYPTTDSDFDKSSYDIYLADNLNPLTLEEWRRNNVNTLISSSFDAIKYINKDVVFSVSPTASIDDNREKLYADVEEWVKSGYIDYIIPQLYFGFEYPDSQYRFNNLVDDWKEIVSKSEVGLLIGLANYKAIPELENDIEEWTNNDDIIARQVKICKNDNMIEGYVYFSYSSLFSEKEPFKKQRENIVLTGN